MADVLLISTNVAVTMVSRQNNSISFSTSDLQVSMALEGIMFLSFEMDMHALSTKEK